MTDELKHTPLENEHRSARRQARPVRRLAHADRVRGRARRAPGRPRTGRSVRPHAPGQGRRHRSRRDRHAAARRHERSVEGGGGRGPLQPRPERGRRGDRGPDRLPARAGAILRRAERLERAAGAAHAGGRTGRRSAPPDVSPGLVLPGGAGAGVGPRDARPVPRGGRPGVHAVRRVGVPPASGHRDPLRLHRRGGLRALHVPGHRRRPVDRPLRGDGPVRRDAVRPGRAGRAPPGDGLPALRPGSVRVLDRARGRSGLGRRVRQGRVPRAGGAAATARRGTARAACAGS